MTHIWFKYYILLLCAHAFVGMLSQCRWMSQWCEGATRGMHGDVIATTRCFQKKNNKVKWLMSGVVYLEILGSGEV